MYVHIQAFNSTNKLFIIINTDFLSLSHTHVNEGHSAALGTRLFFFFFFLNTHTLSHAGEGLGHSAALGTRLFFFFFFNTHTLSHAGKGHSAALCWRQGVQEWQRGLLPRQRYCTV
jgi:hypothetical protein